VAGGDARPTFFRDREEAGRPVGVDYRLEACATEDQEQAGGLGHQGIKERKEQPGAAVLHEK